MKLMKATLRRLWWLTRTTSIVVGLAVMGALVAGVVSLAVAKPPEGDVPASVAVLKGVVNTANAVTTLINSGPGAALSLQSNDAAPLKLEVTDTTKPPLEVNSGTAVEKLNTDKLDGKDSSAFASFAFYVVSEDVDRAELSDGLVPRNGGSVSCNENDVAVGGGASTNEVDAPLIDSRPFTRASDGRSSWTGSWAFPYEGSSSQPGGKVWVVCATHG